jgi:transposase-like protein
MYRPPSANRRQAAPVQRDQSFKGRQFIAEIILRYLMFPVSYRDLEHMLRGRGIEQDHCRVKRRTYPRLGFGSFWTARRTLAGYQAMAMIRKRGKLGTSMTISG